MISLAWSAVRWWWAWVLMVGQDVCRVALNSAGIGWRFGPGTDHAPIWCRHCGWAGSTAWLIHEPVASGRYWIDYASHCPRCRSVLQYPRGAN